MMFWIFVFLMLAVLAWVETHLGRICEEISCRAAIRRADSWVPPVRRRRC